MKTFCLTIVIVVVMLSCTNGIQAQTTLTKLNQVELMKQFGEKFKMYLTIPKNLHLPFPIQTVW